MTHGKHSRAKIDRMTLADERLILAITQMRDEMGAVRGWQAKVAERTGIDRAIISKLLSRERMGVDKETIDKVVAKVPLRYQFFNDRTLKDPKYTDFVGKDSSTTLPAVKVGDDEEPGNIEAKLHSFEAMLTSLRATEEERAAWVKYLAMFPVPYFNATHVQAFIGGLRAKLDLQAAIDQAVNQSAESEMRATGRRKIDDGSEPEPG